MIKKLSLLSLLVLWLSADIYAQVPNATYTYTGKPRFQILTKRNNATLGIINVELFPNIAVHHTRNFDSLVSKQFFDTTAFHRVIPGFMIQGGDPNSRHGDTLTWGFGQPNQPNVNAEFSTAKHVRGILSAARDNNINSANSQFFICHAAAASLNGQYSVYGRVTSGINFVDTIANAPRNSVDRPFKKIEMFITYIGSNDSVPNPPVLTTPANGATNLDTTFQTLLKWNNVSDGIIYNVQVSTDSTFATVNVSGNVGGLLYVLQPTLLGNTKYFWRVQTNNGGHFSAWSAPRSFKTAKLDVGIKDNMIEMEAPLVYPNPSTGKFTFSNIKAGNSIEIFDLIGKLIFETTAETNTVNVELKGMAKGIYSYRVMNAEGGTRQGKLIVK